MGLLLKRLDAVGKSTIFHPETWNISSKRNLSMQPISFLCTQKCGKLLGNQEAVSSLGCRSTK